MELGQTRPGPRAKQTEKRVSGAIGGLMAVVLGGVELGKVFFRDYGHANLPAFVLPAVAVSATALVSTGLAILWCVIRFKERQRHIMRYVAYATFVAMAATAWFGSYLNT